MSITTMFVIAVALVVFGLNLLADLVKQLTRLAVVAERTNHMR